MQVYKFVVRRPSMQQGQFLVESILGLFSPSGRVILDLYVGGFNQFDNHKGSKATHVYAKFIQFTHKGGGGGKKTGRKLQRHYSGI